MPTAESRIFSNEGIDLPHPTKARWQPLRLGLVELFHYDSEEFWFKDGHLLLRGNNGTGKSKVLSLTMPFLFDAQLKSSRIEPDGDPGKKMAWNLLLGSLDRRMGYAWIEFGCIQPDGTARFLTLGAGLSAVAARPQVDSWFFVLEGSEAAPRLNKDIWLTSPERVVLTRERLREALQGHGQIFPTSQAYRRAVDERLFQLGQARYDALIDTLIQLRQPQLSKKPDEAALSNALSEALPPIPAELLADVADALGQLEDDRHQLEEYERLSQAVDRFEKQYRLYAGTQTRRQARSLRRAQTEFDSASRTKHDADSTLAAKQQAEEQLANAERSAELALSAARTSLDTLRADPAMQDANRLERAEQDAKNRAEEVVKAKESVNRHRNQAEQEERQTRASKQRLDGAGASLSKFRQEAAAAAASAGFHATFGENELHKCDAEKLSSLAPKDFDRASTLLRQLISQRRQDTAAIRNRLEDCRRLEVAKKAKQEACDDIKDAVEDAVARRVAADELFQEEGQRLTELWQNHLLSLQELKIDASVVIPQLAEWTLALQGENPVVRALTVSQASAAAEHAGLRADLSRNLSEIQQHATDLQMERKELISGVDPLPASPYTRSPDARTNRPGAPLWQLVDFEGAVSNLERSGIEAALEASGLLDAWVSPDGKLEVSGGDALVFDTQLLPRGAIGGSLADWLVPVVPSECEVSHDLVHKLLCGIACGAQDSQTEAWIGLDGRFRLGSLSGAWQKPVATFIGFTARGQARVARIAEIDVTLKELAEKRQQLSEALEVLHAREERAKHEWISAPTDTALRQAALEAAARASAVQERHTKLAQAERMLNEAVQALQAAQKRLEADAQDLQLPHDLDGLRVVEHALDAFNDAQSQLVHAAREIRLIWPDHLIQRDREERARESLGLELARFVESETQASNAQATLQTLQAAVGLKVGELKERLIHAGTDVDRCESGYKAASKHARDAGEARAVAQTTAAAAEATLQQKSAVRGEAVAMFQRFAASGIFAAGLPDLPLPDETIAWTIDPALTLARRAEQLLVDLNDSDESWTRIQRHISEDLTTLQLALSALGYRCTAELTDFGQVVTIVYQNRAERPDRVTALLQSEIADRRELLTSKEREVLENHLQAEIAATVQRLLNAADKHVNAVNKELEKRPTSTGVRFRLVWQPLTEDEGAPVGLAAARERLLNTSSDLWSSEDRRVVGTMLQQRISAERERTDAGLSGDASAALPEQLARALDYRRWHRFRVERWQGKQWRKLSGPASSGERALGLTVPLFAAVASFYGQGKAATAPRLILLDEAFAGIDDAARAHCMALVREFDLDFIITSEREWGCYAALPGVSICQLQRKEGIDAVYVSRWAWDGKTKRLEDDPDRRFPPKP